MPLSGGTCSLKNVKNLTFCSKLTFFSDPITINLLIFQNRVSITSYEAVGVWLSTCGCQNSEPFVLFTLYYAPKMGRNTQFQLSKSIETWHCLVLPYQEPTHLQCFTPTHNLRGVASLQVILTPFTQQYIIGPMPVVLIAHSNVRVYID